MRKRHELKPDTIKSMLSTENDSVGAGNSEVGVQCKQLSSAAFLSFFFSSSFFSFLSSFSFLFQ